MILILHYTEASEPENESTQKWIFEPKINILQITEFFKPKIFIYPKLNFSSQKSRISLIPKFSSQIESLLRAEIIEPKIEIILRSEVFESKPRFHYVFRLSSRKSLLKDLKPFLLNFQKCGELFIPRFFGWNIFNVTVTTNFFAEFDTKSFQGAEF